MTTNEIDEGVKMASDLYYSEHVCELRMMLNRISEQIGNLQYQCQELTKMRTKVMAEYCDLLGVDIPKENANA